MRGKREKGEPCLLYSGGEVYLLSISSLIELNTGIRTL